MKKSVLLSLVLGAAVWGAWGQTTVSQEVVALGSLGLGDDADAVAAYAGDLGHTNGYTVNTNLTFTSKVAYFYDIYVKLNGKNRTGSAYQELQLLLASNQEPATFSITVDSAYGKLNLLNVLGLADPFDLYLTAGKFYPLASNFQKLSPFGTESALNMLKLGNALNAGLELTYKVPVGEDGPGAVVPLLSLQAVTALTTTNGINRLNDSTGSYGPIGQIPLGDPLGRYALPLFTSLKVTNLPLGFGTLSAEAVHTLNGANVYSGSSFGSSVLVTVPVIPEVLSLPFGLGAAYYEKNIDVLAGAVDTEAEASTDGVDYYRGTLRAGASAGVRYLVPEELAVDVNLACSLVQLSHVQRENLSLVGASVDAKVTVGGTGFVGAGLLLGTLSEVSWNPKEGVSTNKMVFAMAENYGAEVYCGLNFGTKGTLVLGWNNNRGLAQNYGLESLRDGEYKFKQKNSLDPAGLWETSAVFLKTSFKL